MAELGEPVTVAMLVDPMDECPFSHDPPPNEQIPQNLIGSGQKLAHSMKQRKPTFTRSNAPGYEVEPPLRHPRNVPDHPFHKSKQPAIRLRFPGPDGTEEEFAYPVTCAAHHLIPAQESLKRSQLLAYMIAKQNPGDGAKVKTGKSTQVKKGLCWSNLGYDVNGSQNGVYLPGSYAVHDGTWVPVHEEDTDYPPAGMGMAADPKRLTGGVVCDETKSKKWLYVREAVRLASSYTERGYGGQFHDRHEPYSDFVLEALEALHALYKNKEEVCVVDEQCGECKKRKKEIEEKGVPTPFGLLIRLNTISSRLESCLKGTVWRPGLYTSEWGRAYIEKLQEAQKRK